MYDDSPQPNSALTQRNSYGRCRVGTAMIVVGNLSEVCVHTFRNRSQLAFALVLLVLGVVFGIPAGAQQYLGTLSGDVEDVTGARVAGAQVIATNAATKFETKAVTNGTGEYVLPSLNPGTYAVTVSAGGFRTETRTQIELTSGANVQTHFALKSGTT